MFVERNGGKMWGLVLWETASSLVWFALEEFFGLLFFYLHMNYKCVLFWEHFPMICVCLVHMVLQSYL